MVNLPGKVISEAVKFSRDKAQNSGARGYAFFVHLDGDALVDPSTNEVTTLLGKPVDLEATYSVALGLDLGIGSGVNEPLMRWAETNPSAVPDKDTALSLKPLIAEYFTRQIWTRLPPFDAMDVHGTGALTFQEVHTAYLNALADIDQDGQISDIEQEAAEQMADMLMEACCTEALGDPSFSSQQARITRDAYDHLLCRDVDRSGASVSSGKSTS